MTRRPVPFAINGFMFTVMFGVLAVGVLFMRVDKHGNSIPLTNRIQTSVALVVLAVICEVLFRRRYSK